MIWTGIGLTNKTDKYKFLVNLEERVYVPIKQKDFMIDYKTILTKHRLMPVIGLSIWNHTGISEMRPYYGVDSKYFRLMVEHRIFLTEKMVNRLRARISYKQKLSEWVTLFGSEEIF
jgi:hypothetical protein